MYQDLIKTRVLAGLRRSHKNTAQSGHCEVPSDNYDWGVVRAFPNNAHHNKDKSLHNHEILK